MQRRNSNIPSLKLVRRFPPPCWTQDEALGLIQAYQKKRYALRRGYLRTADWDAVAKEVIRICPGVVPTKTSAQCRHKMERNSDNVTVPRNERSPSSTTMFLKPRIGDELFLQR
ncbi:unnamed protein product [Lactuca virosa]|uniref:Myb-like domain-containing protein n=1 Tax=Lactuca virosa TaxID=75947 RepID=A0AAU9LUX5_9ASTR|nr:unnamed protein product [Lactuca virosa]